MPAKTIMIQGTASNVGKSIMATAFCRILKRNGYRVAPFKAQNMSNNSFATKDGGEIARAQAVQAEACEVESSVLMNPILLKPTSNQSAQLVLLGKPVKTVNAWQYQARKPKLIPTLREALNRLMKSFDVVVIEGAGSPVEINIKNDVVNMAIAGMVKAPVILVGDIDKGGIFAQLMGTFQLLKPSEKRLIHAFLINKFRGDKSILTPGLKWIEKNTRRKIMGVVPYISELDLPEEDSVALERISHSNFDLSDAEQLQIRIVRLPKISNFTDFDPLKKEKDVRAEYLEKPGRNFFPDLVILPGSKNTISDLKYLWKAGWVEYLQKCVALGVPILGVCGGFQMLGEKVLDPDRVEANESGCKGLGLLKTVTVFRRKKVTAQVKALHLESQTEIMGYEIHMGETKNNNGATPFSKVKERNGVAVDGIYEGVTFETKGLNRPSFITGTYLHGLFDRPEFRTFFLNKIRGIVALKPNVNAEAFQNNPALKNYDRLANIVERAIDMKLLSEILAMRLPK